MLETIHKTLLGVQAFRVQLDFAIHQRGDTNLMRIMGGGQSSPITDYKNCNSSNKAVEQVQMS